MFSSAGANVLALHTDNHKKSSDDRPRCLENPRPAGAESTLTENVASPFHAEPRHDRLRDRFIPVHGFTAHFPTGMRFEHRAHATQHRFMVICDEDAFCRVSHWKCIERVVWEWQYRVQSMRNTDRYDCFKV